jgi:pimeloyl-ACP methyl ester carboxylesterase
VINFAGGWTSQRCDEGGPVFNHATFASAGGRTGIPMLWLYAEEDRYYSAASIRRYHEAFTQTGGVATFHLFPAIGGDGHRLVDRIEIWKAAADDFLRRLNLASR